MFRLLFFQVVVLMSFLRSPILRKMMLACNEFTQVRVGRSSGCVPDSARRPRCQGGCCAWYEPYRGAVLASFDAAAIVALQLPGEPIRLQWRRKKEFAFEPSSPSMSISVRVVLDEQKSPVYWTVEIWSAPRVQRPALVPPAATC